MRNLEHRLGHTTHSDLHSPPHLAPQHGDEKGHRRKQCVPDARTLSTSILNSSGMRSLHRLLPTHEVGHRTEGGATVTALNTTGRDTSCDAATSNSPSLTHSPTHSHVF
ncbi:hypothetical protein TcWFU_008906 [Taenia crassiceps]|uniref:Uncharacterized protein n=1 Tax=Taenia crassiceps TaxID=6207 RepID=A0ABR4Q354_9CEST